MARGLAQRASPLPFAFRCGGSARVRLGGGGSHFVDGSRKLAFAGIGGRRKFRIGRVGMGMRESFGHCAVVVGQKSVCYVFVLVRIFHALGVSLTVVGPDGA